MQNNIEQRRRKLRTGRLDAGLPIVGAILACQRCDKEIVWRSSRHRFCDDCSTVVREESYRTRHKAKQEAVGATVVGAAIRCAVCGAHMAYRGGHHKYCSEKCRRVVYRPVNRPKGATGLCPVCKSNFNAKSWNQGFCSSECQAAADVAKRAARHARHRAKRKSDPAYRLDMRMSIAIRYALKNRKGGRSWEAIVGYSCDELMRHLERQFLPEMSWENIAEWHVDHIVPKSSFSYGSASSPEFLAAWSLTNLRPLWKLDNLKKHAKREFLI